MRKPIIAGNWKMYKTIQEVRDFLADFHPRIADVRGVEIVLCAPFTALPEISRLAGSPIKLGAQNLFWEDQGAYTGEISPVMLKDLGVSYVIIGHSERRQYFYETDETVNKRIKAALKHGLCPIVCVGEQLAEREAGRQFQVIGDQLRQGLAGLTGQEAKELVIAYEPVWAIGTGKNASPADAQEVIVFIRQTIAKLFDEEIANSLRIQYGGSVKPDNISGFMSQPDIDGALVGGASLDPAGFAAVVRYEE